MIRDADNLGLILTNNVSGHFCVSLEDKNQYLKMLVVSHTVQIMKRNWFYGHLINEQKDVGSIPFHRYVVKYLCR